MAVETPSAFGALLRRYREAVGLSQEELAERAGLSAAAIGALERGQRRRPYPYTVRILADALQLEGESRAALIAAVPRREAGRSLGQEKAAPGSEYALARPSSGPEAAAVPGRAVAFVGRRSELEILRGKLADTIGGRGGLVMLAGEAGIGKTCLARQFAEEAAVRGASLLWGCCFEGDWQPAFGPWVEALSRYAGTRDPEDLRRELGAGASPLARLVPAVRVALPDLPPPSPLSADEERFRLYDAVIQFLLTAAERQPVLLVLDDLHWADLDSLRLLRYMARFVQRARVLVVGVYRDPEFGLGEDHPLMDTLSVLRREVGYERIVIRGFNREEVGEYLTQNAGQPLPQALVRVIEEETSGNPFYAREIFRHLSEEAKLLQRGGQWTTDISIRELGIPEGVRQVVGRRVARLSQQTGALLRLAAGFTSGFGFDVLQTLSELPEQALLDALDEALQAGLIRSSARVPPRYEFAHAIVRHALYEGLNPDRRARLHRRIALALEQRQAAEAAEDAAEIAAQYHASVALPGAGQGVAYALKAAGQARAMYAHERTAGFLRLARGLAAESPPAERADVLRQLAVAEAEAVRLEDAQRTVEEALEAMNAAGVEPRSRAEFLVTVARALKDGGAEARVWEPLVARGLALTEGKRNLLWARLTLLHDHFEPVQSGPIGGSLWQGSDPEAVAAARAEGDEEDYARTLDPFDWRTREETEAVLALAGAWSRPDAIMRALDVAGRDLLYRHGSFRQALGVYEELLAVSERFGSIPNQGEALTHIATAQIVTGDLSLGQQTLRRAQEAILRLGASHRMYNWVPISRACVVAYFLDGDWPSLAAQMQGFAMSAEAWRSPTGIVAGAIAALSAVRAGDLGGARAVLQDVTSVLRRSSPTTYGQSTALAAAAIAVWELEAVEFAETCRNMTLDLLSVGTGDTGLGPLELILARMSSLMGRFEEAEECFRKAHEKIRECGHTHMGAIADYDQARALLRAGVTDRARIVQLLDAALAGFHAHGMLGWAAKASEQKQKLMTAARPIAPEVRRHRPRSP